MVSSKKTTTLRVETKAGRWLNPPVVIDSINFVGSDVAVRWEEYEEYVRVNDISVEVKIRADRCSSIVATSPNV